MRSCREAFLFTSGSDLFYFYATRLGNKAFESTDRPSGYFSYELLTELKSTVQNNLWTKNALNCQIALNVRENTVVFYDIPQVGTLTCLFMHKCIIQNSKGIQCPESTSTLRKLVYHLCQKYLCWKIIFLHDLVCFE